MQNKPPMVAPPQPKGPGANKPKYQKSLGQAAQAKKLVSALKHKG